MKICHYEVAMKSIERINDHELVEELRILGDGFCSRLWMRRTKIDNIRVLLEYLWEKLHSVHWKCVHMVYRELYSAACYLYAEALMSSSASTADVLNIVDMGLLLGADLCRPALLSMANAIGIDKPLKKRARTNSLRAPSFSRSLAALWSPSHLAATVRRHCSPSLLEFSSQYLLSGSPVILENCIHDWPAMQPSRWMNLDYIISVAGQRTVPVEVGRTYLDESSGQALMTISEFIERHILGVGAESTTGYLAQHELFEQVPQLRDDIMVPDYCCLLTPEDEEFLRTPAPPVGGSEAQTQCGAAAEEVVINAWFGPTTTISPLHHDPYHNLLAQVTGFKYVRVYDPRETEHLYPIPGKLSNNSQVDILQYDSAAFPLMQKAPYFETVLGPGEMLFIPRHWWHFIAALDSDAAADARSKLGITSLLPPRPASIDDHPEFSFSVSFWWGPRREKSTAGGSSAVSN